MKLYKFQEQALQQVKDKKNCLFAYDMGLGKTYLGCARLKQQDRALNLVICQKSKIQDWLTILSDEGFTTYNLTKKKDLENFMQKKVGAGVINYELAWRRLDLLKLNNFSLLLDESSLIQNEKTKKTKFILKLNPHNSTLLSGTVCNGNYDKLWSQLKLLGWDIKKSEFYRRYCVMRDMDLNGVKFRIVVGYKNVQSLKNKLAKYGGIFKKTDEVMELPQQTFIMLKTPAPKPYIQFLKSGYVEINDDEYIADYELTARLNMRVLLSAFNKKRLEQVKDLIDSTDDRIVIFYNFNSELDELKKIIKDRPISEVNGSTSNIANYLWKSNSVTLVQYRAGSMGLNLQKANKIVYYSLPDGRAEEFAQSLKRIHRIGQVRPCFYYLCICPNTIEDEILKNLKIKNNRIEYLWTL